jgi:hypothetical protein
MTPFTTCTVVAQAGEATEATPANQTNAIEANRIIPTPVESI